MGIKIIILIVFLGLYSLLCYYLGIKIKNICIKNKIQVNNIIYWSGHWILSFSFVFANFLKYYIGVDEIITYIFTIIGSIFIVELIYCTLLFLIADFISFVLKKLNLNFKFLKKIYCSGLSVLIISSSLTAYGFYNAKNKVVTNYEITIDKECKNFDELNIVMVSDIHMGIEVKEKEIDEMVDSINSLNADAVFLCGDIFDESSYLSLEQYASEKFKDIKSKYGVYAIAGNHEYFSEGTMDIINRLYDNADIKFLDDEVINICDSFYVAGLNDDTFSKINNKNYKSLESILQNADNNSPIILLNHKPERLSESIDNNVDLQLSGHTHRGQIYPGNIITNFIYDDDYGYLKEGKFNLIVSSGFGTWGFPVRIGSRSEIVNVKVNFKNN